MERAASPLAVPCGLEASKLVGVRSGEEAKSGESRMDQVVSSVHVRTSPDSPSLEVRVG